MANHILSIETMEPGRYHIETQPAAQVVQRFPQFAGIVDHRDFCYIDYVVGERRVRIKFFQEGQNA